MIKKIFTLLCQIFTNRNKSRSRKITIGTNTFITKIHLSSLYHSRDIRRQSLNHFCTDFTINLDFLQIPQPDFPDFFIQFFKPFSKPKSRNVVQKFIANVGQSFSQFSSFLPKFLDLNHTIDQTTLPNGPDFCADQIKTFSYKVPKFQFNTTFLVACGDGTKLHTKKYHF